MFETKETLIKLTSGFRTGNWIQENRVEKRKQKWSGTRSAGDSGGLKAEEDVVWRRSCIVKLQS